MRVMTHKHRFIIKSQTPLARSVHNTHYKGFRERLSPLLYPKSLKPQQYSHALTFKWLQQLQPYETLFPPFPKP